MTNGYGMTQASNFLKNVSSLLATILGYVSGVTMVLGVFFIAADVVLRYLFNKPILGGSEVVGLLMVIAVSTGLVYTGSKDGHISITLVFVRLSKRIQTIIVPCIYFLSLCLFGLMSWRSVVQGLKWQAENPVTQTLSIPYFPFSYLIAFACAVFCLVLLIKFLDSLAPVVNGGRGLWRWLMLGIALVLLLLSFPVWFRSATNPIVIAIVGFIVMLVLIFLNVPIAFAMALVGIGGVILFTSIDIGLDLLGRKQFIVTNSYDLSVVMFFLLMGMYAFYSGLGRDLYNVAYYWLGHLPGGLAIATIGGCGLFAAICGSTVATAAAMSSVSWPELKRYKYDYTLAAGSMAAGGTLGILIPPSTVLVLFGILTGNSIGRLLIAGILPGILLMSLFIVTIYVLCKRNPSLGPPGPKFSFKEKLQSLSGLWGVIILFVLVIGGIYMGIFTPTEGAGIGAFAAFLFMLIKKVSKQGFKSAMLETVDITGMTIFIFVGGMMLGAFLGVTQAPVKLIELVGSLQIDRYLILFLIFIIYNILGCLMDGLTILIVITPIFYPILTGLGFDPIWIGVMVVLLTEMSLVTPPVGANCFVIAAMIKEIPLDVVFRGIVPFFVAMIICFVIITIFPQIVTFLPSFLY